MRYVLVILLIVGIASCKGIEEELWVDIDNSNVTDSRGVVKLNGEPFSGILYRLMSNGDTAYVKGYVNGKLEGQSRGWYEDGSRKYIYHYRNDVFDGEVKEWFPNGKLYRVFHYVEGQEEGIQTMYWDNGKLRANYQSKNGRKYGLTGIKNCTSPWSDSLKQLLAGGM